MEIAIVENNMINKIKSQDSYQLWGKIIGFTASFFWGIALLLYSIFGEENLSLEGFLLLILIIFNITGIIIAWKNTKTGSVFIIIASFILSIFAFVSAGYNKILVILFSGLPFLIAGILFSISAKTPKDNHVK